MSKISEVKQTNPFPDLEYQEIESVLGKPLEILEAVSFENKNGPGVHIRARMDGKEVRFCTHGVAICDTLGRPEVLETLKEESIECKFVKEKSTKDPRKEVLKLVDADA